MNDKEILFQIKQLDLGIVPFFVWLSQGTVNEDRWKEISPSEARAMKRKFRKIYRKACKRYGLDCKKIRGQTFKRNLINRFLKEKGI